MEKYIKEELTLAEFAEKFIGITDFTTPCEYDLSGFDIQVLGKNLETGKDEYKKIKTFLVKESVKSHYTDENLRGSGQHRLIELKLNRAKSFGAGEEIYQKSKHYKNVPLEIHKDFKLINEPLNIVDIEVDGENYYANGRLNHNTTSGGKAIAFHSSVRLRLKCIGQIKQKTKSEDRVLGVKARAQVIKNRVAPPFRTADFDMYFDRGIDDYESWLNILKDYDVAKRSSPGYKMDDQNGEEVKFELSNWKSILESKPEFKEFVYNKICDILITKYRSESTIGLSEDDTVVHTDEVVGEE